VPEVCLLHIAVYSFDQSLAMTLYVSEATLIAAANLVLSNSGYPSGSAWNRTCVRHWIAVCDAIRVWRLDLLSLT